MQKHDPIPEFAQVSPSAAIATATHGWRAKCLQRLVRLDLPVPKSVALPAATVRAIAAGHGVDAARAPAPPAGGVGSCEAPVGGPRRGVRAMRSSDIESVCALDRQAFGADAHHLGDESIRAQPSRQGEDTFLLQDRG